MDIFHTMTLATFGFSAAYALPALLVLLVIEEAGIPVPVPGDTLLMVAGAVAIDQPFWYAPLVIAIGAIGALAGSSILYFAMRRGGRAFVERFGKWLFLGPRRMARVQRWFARNHRHALLFGRLIPGLRMPTTALAGLSGLEYRQYLPAASIAALVWSTAYFLIGMLLRLTGISLFGPLKAVVRAVPAPLLAAIVVLLVADAALLAWLAIARWRASAETADASAPQASGVASRRHMMSPERQTSARDAEDANAPGGPRQRDRELVD